MANGIQLQWPETIAPKKTMINVDSSPLLIMYAIGSRLD